MALSDKNPKFYGCLPATKLQKKLRAAMQAAAVKWDVLHLRTERQAPVIEWENSLSEDLELRYKNLKELKKNVWELSHWTAHDQKQTGYCTGYSAAHAYQISKANTVILGGKTILEDIDPISAYGYSHGGKSNPPDGQAIDNMAAAVNDYGNLPRVFTGNIQDGERKAVYNKIEANKRQSGVLFIETYSQLLQCLRGGLGVFYGSILIPDKADSKGFVTSYILGAHAEALGWDYKVDCIAHINSYGAIYNGGAFNGWGTRWNDDAGKKNFNAFKKFGKAVAVFAE
jgi:hypothetical protein